MDRNVRAIGGESRVPLAALGFMPPLLAALGMSVSSLVVVMNAMRIGRGEARDDRGHVPAAAPLGKAHAA